LRSLAIYISLFMVSCAYSDDVEYNRHEHIKSMFEPVLKIKLPNDKAGTGVVIYSELTQNGYRSFVLTAAHVAHGCISTEIPTGKIKILPAKAVITKYDQYGYVIQKCETDIEVVSMDPPLDLAIMEITDRAIYFDYVFKIAPQDYTVRMLDDISVVGCTMAKPTNLTLGKIIELEGTTNNEYYAYNAEHIRVSAPVSYGNSGGAVLNSKNEIIGILSSMFTEHIGYAVSLENIYDFINDGGYEFLLEKGKIPNRVKIIKESESPISKGPPETICDCGQKMFQEFGGNFILCGDIDSWAGKSLKKRKYESAKSKEKMENTISENDRDQRVVNEVMEARRKGRKAVSELKEKYQRPFVQNRYEFEGYTIEKFFISSKNCI